MGEGWGLVSFEHASTGAAQIVPDHTACAALWDGTTAQMMGPSEWVIPGFSPLEMGVLTPETVAEALARLHADPVRRARVGGCRPPVRAPAGVCLAGHRHPGSTAPFRGLLPDGGRQQRQTLLARV